MKTPICDQTKIYEFEVMPPLYLPFYNRWGSNSYQTYDPFCYDPFKLRAVSTSGSPVILVGNQFFGFTTEVGGIFSYDGKFKLMVECPAGQELWYNEDCDPYREWEQYSAYVASKLPAKRKEEDFWSDLEYCTWVDQKKEAVLKGSDNMWSCLNEQYVYDYMKRVDRLGLPKGKLTIDDGWDIRYAPDGKLCYGNWDVDREKFPHMEQLVRDMSNNGFYPGLWFAPFTFTPNSRLATQYPELIGDTFSEKAEGEAVRRLMFIKPNPVLECYYREIFSKYIDMGFKKFKLDMSYGSKAEMKELLRIMYDVIKSIDPTVEVEAHIPDIFVSRYCDTVRLNDVSFEGKHPWRAVTVEHYKVCRYSSPDRILNLDHLGANTPTPKESDYMNHTKLIMSMERGYPCVSLLPDFFGQSVSDAFVKEIHQWKERRKK